MGIIYAKSYKNHEFFRYHVAVTFSDGLIVAFLDGQEVFVFQDRSPLYGPNNQYLGIGGDWATDTTLIFDNVVIAP